MRISKKALLASAFFIALFSEQPATAGACQPAGARQLVAVGQVIDGDTVRLVDGRSVRLIGVNTPELHLHDERAAEPLALEAKQFVEQLLSGRRTELVFDHQDKDKYGRLLGYLLADGELVAEQLLESGLGWAIAISPNTGLAECLFDIEQRARQAGRALWSTAPQRAAAVSQSGFAVLSGQVTRVDLTRKYSYLELDNRVVVRLAADRSVQGASAQGASAQGASAQTTTAPLPQPGERLLVRGWIIDRGEDYTKRYPQRLRYMLPLSSDLNIRLVD